MDILDSKDIALIGRNQNGVVLKYDKQIVISSDILKIDNREIDRESHITISDVEKKIEMFADNILLSGLRSSTHNPEPVVYGEALVETLRWMITVLKTHSHPPNGIAIPDFHIEADSRSNNFDTYLLNQYVKTR